MAIAIVNCPNCDTPVTNMTCTHVKDNVRIRYRRCKACNHSFKTEQLITAERVIKYSPHARTGAKLTPDEVQDIRRLIKNRIFNPLDLAMQYEVQPQTIYRIASRKSWSHIPDSPT